MTLAFSAQAGEIFPVVTEGRAQALVVLGTRPTAIERRAAEDLVQTVHEMTGARLRTVAADASAAQAAKRLIVIGRGESNEVTRRLIEGGLVRLSSDAPGLDGFVIETVADGDRRCLVLGGSQDRGTLYAVYELLEAHLGVGFFPDGDRIPRRESIGIGEISLARRPQFPLREWMQGCAFAYSTQFWGWPEWKREIEWMARKKFNLLHLVLGAEVVWKERIWPQFGVSAGKPTPHERFQSDLVKRICDYARSLGIETVGPAFGGSVPSEFVAAHPEAKTLQIQWLDYPPTTYLRPDDPLFVEIGEALIREYNAVYGTDHFYNMDPYPECDPGATPEEKLAVKVGFARAVAQSIRRADPQGTWIMSGWAFLDTKVWPKQVVADFLRAIPNDRFIINDIWADVKPIYQRLDYFWDKPWGFGVLHAFGGTTNLYGDLDDLIRRAGAVAEDAQARRCINFYVNPEIIHHNTLYYDLACALAWDPRGVDLESFLDGYALRRYGEADGRLRRCLALLADSVYSTNDLTNPAYMQRMNTGPAARDRLRFAAALQTALGEALAGEQAQRDNGLYQGDVIEICRQWLGELFNLRAAQAYNAFLTGDEAGFERAAEAVMSLLDAQAMLLSTDEDYRLETEIARGQRLPGAGDVAKAVRTRYTILGDLEHYPTLLDYARKDMFELVRYYYRPRVEVWLAHLRSLLAQGSTETDWEALDEEYRAVVERFVNQGYSIAPGDRFEGTPLEAAGRIYAEMRLSADEFAELTSGKQALENAGFEEGWKGWAVVRRGSMRPAPTDAMAHSGARSLHFVSSDEDGRLRDFSASQRLRPADPDPQVSVWYRLVKATPVANANLTIEAYDDRWRKRAQLVYFFGGDNWGWGNEKPDRTGGFYTFRTKVDSTPNRWLRIVAHPSADLDQAHGKGTWESLEVAALVVSLRAWALERDQNAIEGYFDDVEVK